MKAFKRGDIIRLTLNPVQGREMQGDFRPAIVLSEAPFNQLGTTLIAPITQGGDFARVAGFAVTLMGSGTQTQGAIILNQCKMLDLSARAAKLIERAPSDVIEEALAKLQAIVA
jgi:mRNA interferase ChpB